MDEHKNDRARSYAQAIDKLARMQLAEVGAVCRGGDGSIMAFIAELYTVSLPDIWADLADAYSRMRAE